MEQNITPQATVIHMCITIGVLFIGVIVAIIAQIKDNKQRARNEYMERI